MLLLVAENIIHSGPSSRSFFSGTIHISYICVGEGGRRRWPTPSGDTAMLT